MRDDRVVSKFRPRLEAMVAKLEAEHELMAAGRAPVEFDQQSVGRLSHMDAMQQQMAHAIDRQRETQMARIRNALDRMDKGKFGICAECGENTPRSG